MTDCTDTTHHFEFIDIRYVKSSASGKTHLWDVYNKTHKYYLGSICYRPSWRQYVFEPDEYTEFSAGCLEDIASFMREVRP